MGGGQFKTLKTLNDRMRALKIYYYHYSLFWVTRYFAGVRVRANRGQVTPTVWKTMKASKFSNNWGCKCGKRNKVNKLASSKPAKEEEERRNSEREREREERERKGKRKTKTKRGKRGGG